MCRIGSPVQADNPIENVFSLLDVFSVLGKKLVQYVRQSIFFIVCQYRKEFCKYSLPLIFDFSCPCLSELRQEQKRGTLVIRISGSLYVAV